jgi:hypothetical protein
MIGLSSGLHSHLLTRTRFACFSGLGSWNTYLGANLSLRRGTKLAGSFRDVRERGGMCTRLSGTGKGQLQGSDE